MIRLGARLIAALLAVLCLFAAVTAPAVAQDSVRLAEQDIKAGLLYNFLRYTRWPGSPGAQPVVVCTYGRDAFNGRLQPMAGRTVNQRQIEVRAAVSERDLGACSLIFINAEARREWPRLRAFLGARSILTVSDYDGFARAGGMLEFARVNNRIGVRVNVNAARAAQLSVDDRLLRLATIVESDAP